MYNPCDVFPRHGNYIKTLISSSSTQTNECQNKTTCLCASGCIRRDDLKTTTGMLSCEPDEGANAIYSRPLTVLSLSKYHSFDTPATSQTAHIDVSQSLPKLLEQAAIIHFHSRKQMKFNMQILL